MPRLRPVFLGTETLPDGTVRDRVVLVLDHLPPEQVTPTKEHLGRHADLGFPPVLVFAGAVDLVDREAYALDEAPPSEQHQPVLVLGATRVDASLMADRIEAPGEVWTAGADRYPGLLDGLYKPVVVRTPAYQELDSETKDRLEKELSLIRSKS